MRRFHISTRARWLAPLPNMLLLLRACLGLFPDAPHHTLHVAAPALPGWLDHLTLSRVRIGEVRATLHFTRNRSGTFVSVGEVEGGPLNIRIDLRR